MGNDTGEKMRTKKQIGVTIDTEILAEFKKSIAKHNLGISETVEKLMEYFNQIEGEIDGQND